MRVLVKPLLLFVATSIVLTVCLAEQHKHLKNIAGSSINQVAETKSQIKSATGAISLSNFDRKLLTKSLFGPSFQSRLQNYIDCQVDSYQKSLNNYEITDLDSMRLSVAPTNFDLGFLKGMIELENFELQGVSNIKVLSAKITPTLMPMGVKVSAKLSWPSINALGGYNSNLTFLDRPIDLNGKTKGILKALTLDTNTEISQNWKTTKVQSLSIKPSLDKTDFHLGGLHFNGVDLGSRIASVLNNLPTFVNNNSNDFDQLVSPYVVDLLNQQLNANNGNKTAGDQTSDSNCQFEII